MGRLSPVPIPGKRRLQMFCQSGLPIIAFFGCAVLVYWLWNHNGNGAGTIGEIFARRVELTPQIAGVILSGEGAPKLQEFQEVRKGEVIAMLDPKPLDARIRVLKKEAEQLEASLEEIAETAKFEDQRIFAQYASDKAQIAADAAGLKVNYLEAWEKFRVAETSFKLRQVRYNILLPFAGLEADPSDRNNMRPKEKPTSRIIADPDITTAYTEMREAEETYLAAKSRFEAIKKEGAVIGEIIKSLPPPPTADVEKLLAPVRKEMEAKLAEVQEIEEQKAFLIVRAPFDGVITTVFVRPDQNVQPGTPICTLAATETEYVLAYVRQNSSLRPRVGMKAEVRFRGSKENIPGAIVKVGAHVEAVSLKQLFDPNMQEWGLPIAIQLKWPDEKQVREVEPRAGEIVYVRVLPDEKDEVIANAATDISFSSGAVVFADGGGK